LQRYRPTSLSYRGKLNISNITKSLRSMNTLVAFGFENQKAIERHVASLILRIMAKNCDGKEVRSRCYHMEVGNTDF
jgi:chemotaxis receptor (MCP) glutamine deamidase CheD